MRVLALPRLSIKPNITSSGIPHSRWEPHRLRGQQISTRGHARAESKAVGVGLLEVPKIHCSHWRRLQNEESSPLRSSEPLPHMQDTVRDLTAVKLALPTTIFPVGVGYVALI